MSILDHSGTGLRSPRALSIVLTAAGTVIALAVIWNIVALDPNRLTLMILGADAVQVGTWLAVAGLAAFGVFGAVRYITSTLVASFAGRRRPVEPVLGSASYVLLAAALATGHVLELGSAALVLAVITRTVVRMVRIPAVRAA